MDMGFTSHGKERLLNEDFKLSLSQCKTNKRKLKRASLIYITFLTFNLVACIIACGCAIYCYHVLAELKTLQNLVCTKQEISTATVPLTGSPEPNRKGSDNGSEIESTESEKTFTPATRVSFDTEGVEHNLNDEDYEINESDEEESEYTEYEYVDGSGYETNTDSYSETLGDESGEIFDIDAEKLIRKRRSTKTDIRQCKKQCKGTSKEKKKCRRSCAGKISNKGQKGKTPLQINLPAAHFEANMYDTNAQELVNTKYNKLRNAEKCSYNETMGGVLCINRTFFQSAKSEGPLKIFKQAHWVDGSSPVNFTDNSVATAKYAGVFLVYAQAYIGGDEPEKSIAIVHKRQNGQVANELSCDNGVNAGGTSSSQTQTCAAFGLMKLEKGDTIEIQRSTVTVGISLDQDKTYFGLVQLSGVPTKSQ